MIQPDGTIGKTTIVIRCTGDGAAGSGVNVAHVAIAVAENIQAFVGGRRRARGDGCQSDDYCKQFEQPSLSHFRSPVILTIVSLRPGAWARPGEVVFQQLSYRVCEPASHGPKCLETFSTRNWRVAADFSLLFFTETRTRSPGLIPATSPIRLYVCLSNVVERSDLLHSAGIDRYREKISLPVSSAACAEDDRMVRRILTAKEVGSGLIEDSFPSSCNVFDNQIDTGRVQMFSRVSNLAGIWREGRKSGKWAPVWLDPGPLPNFSIGIDRG